ncbi:MULTISPECIES: proton-conducting transporter membrane subunit [Salinibaculum]|uniref:proton-conducting transporter transmembrane domain-containing protein n=1 Tax=Salinibaculum TaxID=2732368 RepID=UPI0030CC4FD4
MTEHEQSTTVGQRPNITTGDSRLPALFTRLVWLLWVASLGTLALRLVTGWTWELSGLVVVDGLTVTMWATVTFFSGIVHSYSRRYMAGSQRVDRFFARVFAFTLVVMVLVAADSLALFAAAWLAMGLLMAALIGHVRGWPQARTAATLARRYFLASSASLAVALATLWWVTGATTVSGIAAAVGTVESLPLIFAAGALLVAAMVQSALVPFQAWLLSSMTAPTPASALMHAGFVNAGGILLLRFGPVVSVEPGVMLLIVVVGATSALLGKVLKSVQTDVKRQLGCSTVGQMGFMIMQAGLGFFGAAITHLVLHGFYKAYQFLSSGGEIDHRGPADAKTGESTGVAGLAAVVVTALAGGVVFAALTGKGTALDSGLLLTLLVVLTTLHAARETVRHTSLPATLRFGAVPLVFLPAIAVYAGVYTVVESLLVGLPAVGDPAELIVVHGVVAVAFVAAYLAIESGVYRRSTRLYAALVNATQPPTGTLLTPTEEYNDY